MIGFPRRGAALGAALAIVGAASPVGGHPMGNISISHYAGLEIRPEEIEVKFLLDFAEIPAVRELERVDPDRDDRVTPEEREAYLAAKTAEVTPQLRLEVNGKPLELRPEWSRVTFPPGESGLSTVRVAWKLRADLPPGLAERNFLLWNDSTYESFDGWKEVRFTAVDGLGIGKTSLREQPTSGELSEYPEEYLWRPPKDTKAWCQFGTVEVMAASRAAAETEGPPPARPDPAAARAVPRGVLVALVLGGATVLAIVAGVRRRHLRRRGPRG